MTQINEKWEDPDEQFPPMLQVYVNEQPFTSTEACLGTLRDGRRWNPLGCVVQFTDGPGTVIGGLIGDVWNSSLADATIAQRINALKVFCVELGTAASFLWVHKGVGPEGYDTPRVTGFFMLVPGEVLQTQCSTTRGIPTIGLFQKADALAASTLAASKKSSSKPCYTRHYIKR